MYSKGKGNYNSNNTAKPESQRNSSKRKSNYKGKSNAYAKKDVKEDRYSPEDSNVCKTGTNEPKWYNGNDRLVQDAVKITFANQLGRKLGLANDPYFANDNFYKVHDVAVPGVAVFSMINTPGVANDANDGVNIAASQLFQKLRKDLSTYATYSAADVMMYALGIDSIYSQYANIVRLFGILGAYSAYNLYAPKELVCGAYGFTFAEFDHIIKNINDFRSRFNNLIFKASTLYLPVDFSIVARHAWLYSNYFLDTVGKKSQLYIHRMKGFHKLNETLNNNGTALEYIEHATTLSELLDEFATCIEVYRSSDSMLKIAADMRRAFSDSKAWELAYVNETFMIPPSPLDGHLRNQIHNMDIYPSEAYDAIKAIVTEPTQSLFGTFHIGQDVSKNIILYCPTYKIPTHTGAYGGFSPLMCNKILDFDHEEVSSDDILEATRNVLRCHVVDSDGNSLFRPTACGADICVGMDIILHDMSGSAVNSVHYGSQLISPKGDEVRKLLYLEAFASAPYMYSFILDAQSNVAGAEPFCEFDNYTVVDGNVINNINNIVMCNMWSVPSQIGF